MITALVQFRASGADLAWRTPRAVSNAARRNTRTFAGLIRKYYIRSEDGRVAGGIYLWETRQAAERVYDGEWRERVRDALRRRADDHLVRQPGHRRQSRRRHDHQGGMTMPHDDSSTHTRAHGRSAARRSRDAAAAPQRSSRERAAGLARHGPAGARRRLRPDRSMPPIATRSASAASPTASKRARVLGAPERVAYGPTEIEKLDIYRCQGARTRRSTSSSTAAPGVPTGPPTMPSWPSRSCEAGAHYVMLDFTNVDDADGSSVPDGRAGAPRGRLGLPQRQRASAAIPTGSI